MAANLIENVPNTTIAISPDANKQIAGAKRFEAFAADLVIDSADMKAVAAVDLNTIKKLAKDIDETRKTMTKPLDEAKKSIMAFFEPATTSLTKAESIYKQKIIAFDKTEAEKALKLQRELEEKARLQREALEKEAAELAKAGNAEAASIVAEQAQITTAPIVNIAPPKVAGISTRKNWKAEVVDVLALVKAVAEGKAPLELIAPNMTVINRYAKASEDKLNIPGVRAFNDVVIASR